MGGFFFLSNSSTLYCIVVVVHYEIQDTQHTQSIRNLLVSLKTLSYKDPFKNTRRRHSRRVRERPLGESKEKVASDRRCSRQRSPIYISAMSLTKDASRHVLV